MQYRHLESLIDAKLHKLNPLGVVRRYIGMALYMPLECGVPIYRLVIAWGTSVPITCSFDIGNAYWQLLFYLANTKKVIINI